eukprot:SAG31_NODE_264_length_18835_cov_7.543553_4_plen_191_part_00
MRAPILVLQRHFLPLRLVRHRLPFLADLAPHVREGEVGLRFRQRLAALGREEEVINVMKTIYQEKIYTWVAKKRYADLGFLGACGSFGARFALIRKSSALSFLLFTMMVGVRVPGTANGAALRAGLGAARAGSCSVGTAVGGGSRAVLLLLLTAGAVERRRRAVRRFISRKHNSGRLSGFIYLGPTRSKF